MPSERRSRHVQPKLFQCSGFGDCRMVFTRSEHLARHARKHTGEKPFKCVVPECEKMFSRFDNMMQHTQTHRPKRDRPQFTTRSSSRKRPQQPQQQAQRPEEVQEKEKKASSQQRVTQEPWLYQTKKRRPDLCVETREDHTFSGGLVSPISDDDDTCHHKRRISVAELCNPVESNLYLTFDEFEVVQAFDRLRQSPH